MNINIQKKDLEDVLKIANDICNTQSNNIITECIHISTLREQNKIVLKFFNNNIKIQYYISNNIEILEDGEILIKTKMLDSIISKLPNKSISLQKVENNWLTIKQDDFVSNINLIDASFFIDMNLRINNELSSFKLNSDIFKNIKNKIYHACASINEISNPKNKIFTGILLDSATENKKINFISTNSKKISLFSKEFDGPQFKIIFDQMLINFIIANTKENQEIKFYYDEEKVEFELENMIINSKLLIGSFPDVINFFNISDATCSFNVNTKELIDALERGQAIVSVNKIPSVDINTTNEKIALSFKSQEIGNLSDTLKISNFKGSGQKIKINLKYIISILKSFGDDNITIYISNSNPIVAKLVFIDTKDPNFKQLVSLIRETSDIA